MESHNVTKPEDGELARKVRRHAQIEELIAELESERKAIRTLLAAVLPVGAHDVAGLTVTVRAKTDWTLATKAKFQAAYPHSEYPSLYKHVLDTAGTVKASFAANALAEYKETGEPYVYTIK